MYYKNKRALIFGISGQDGIYLTKILIEKKFKVFGTSRIKKNINKKLNKINVKDNVKIFKGNPEKFNEVQKVTDQISDLESECDSLRREVERKIYSETLIPEIRGDVLGMLENLDKIPGQIQGNAHSFNTEKPKVDPELDENFLKLCDYASECISLLIDGSRSFFVDKKITIQKCLEVAKVESKADKISTELKKTIFLNSDNGLATKVHLKYFVEIMDEVANLSEDVADRLIISSSKN